MTVFKTAMRRYTCFTATVLFMTIAIAHADHTAYVRLNVPPANIHSLGDLDDLIVTAFSHSYAIPYQQLRPLVQQQISSALATELQNLGTIVRDCPGYCGEVKLSVNANASFQFFPTNQPVFEIIGPSTDNRLRVTLITGAKVHVNIDLHAVATDVPNTSLFFLLIPPPHDEELDRSVYLDIEIPVKATAQVKLWPTLAQEQLSFEVNTTATVTDNNGLQRELAQVGTELGFLIGFSPGGLLTGGPMAWSITGLIFGNMAGDVIQDLANDAISKVVTTEINKVASEMESRLKSEIDVVAQQGNNFLQQLRSQNIPRLNMTLEQAKDQMGLQEDVRLAMQNTDISAVATARYPATGKSKIRGVLRMPKAECDMHSFGVAGGEITMGVPKVLNQDLASRIGQSCPSALGLRSPFSNALYHGPVPPGTNMPRWSATASPQFTGTLQDVGYAYECPWEINGVAPIVTTEIASDIGLNALLGDYGFSKARFLVSTFSGQQSAWNYSLHPVTDPDGIVFGGAGPELDVAICFSSMKGVNDHPSLGEALKNAIDPETCPQCLELLKDPANRISNPEMRLQRARELQKKFIPEKIPQQQPHQ